ncbi:hypothetical protein Vadar_028586 [Vaccinium darrowii]|uniref:Uncharacterized protein n=1 Tax=Vaccinium darrowii TaxID=229202 RepID=A0ACB7ZFX0_9ERIC|nr:hypothetical protein Vadar_028586 [Vaccinium darrowii]
MPGQKVRTCIDCFMDIFGGCYFNFRKHKLRDDAYELMWSSRNLGQAAVSPSREIEPDSDTCQSTKGLVDIDFWQPVIADREVISKTSLAYTKESVSSSALGAADGYDATKAIEEMSNKIDETCMREDAQDFLRLTFNYDRSESNIPMFLYEAGFGSDKSSLRSGIIGVTQPHHIAVLATAKRVAFELGLQGVDDFVSGRRIFRNPPPVIEVPSRQFLVTVHFSKRTEIVDYVGQAYKKVLSIQNRLPLGGILVFVTGQRKVEYLCQRLRNTFEEMVENISKRNAEKEVSTIAAGNATEENDTKEINEAFEMPRTSYHDQTDRFGSYEEDLGDLDDNEYDFSDDMETDSYLEGADDADLLNHETETNDDPSEVFEDEGRLASLKAAFEVLDGKTTLNPDSGEKLVVPSTAEGCSNQSIPNVGERRGGAGLCAGAMCVLRLYSMLPGSAQLCVLEGIREGECLVVVATNVTETSLTIPGIKYVVDTGRDKVKNYSSNGVETYEVQWISKASAAQRA